MALNNLFEVVNSLPDFQRNATKKQKVTENEQASFKRGLEQWHFWADLRGIKRNNRKQKLRDENQDFIIFAEVKKEKDFIV